MDSFSIHDPVAFSEAQEWFDCLDDGCDDEELVAKEITIASLNL